MARHHYSKSITGYWLVNASRAGKGFGVIWAKGPRAGARNAVWLGSSTSSLRHNLPAAIGRLHLGALYEVPAKGVSSTDPNAAIDSLVKQASKHKVAWFHHGQAGVQADNTFTYAAAAFAAGGPVGDLIGGVLDYAGLTDAFGSDAAGAPKDTIDEGAGAKDEKTPKDEKAAKDESSVKDSNAAKTATPAVTTGSSLDLKAILIRVLEAVGAILLLAIGLRSLMGGDSPTVQVASAAKKAAMVAA